MKWFDSCRPNHTELGRTTRSIGVNHYSVCHARFKDVLFHHQSHRTKGRPPFPVDLSAELTEDCLCLICRQVGHVVQSCPQFPKEDLQGVKVPAGTDVARPSRAFNPPISAAKGSLDSLCRQCNELDVGFGALAGARLVGNNVGHIQRAVIRRTPLASLGPPRTLRLFSTCPLCRLIFDITYLSKNDLRAVTHPKNASKGYLILSAVWTLMHLMPDTQPPKEEWGPRAICAYTQVAQQGDIYHPDFRVRLGVDATAIVDTSEGGGGGGPDIMGRSKATATISSSVAPWCQWTWLSSAWSSNQPGST